MTNFRSLALCGLLSLLTAGSAFSGTKANVCVQSELKALGFYNGEITGKLDQATKAAGDSYIAYMEANNPGWRQPRLSTAEADLWCKQLAAAFPDKLSKYLQAYQGAGSGIVKLTGLSVKNPASTKKPYTVSLDFKVEGDVTLTAACFTWNGKSEVCVPFGEGIKKGPIKVGLTTGRSGEYALNAYVKYVSAGKKLKSAETSTPLKVSD
jgi:Putative peptidoglycan binding domain